MANRYLTERGFTVYDEFDAGHASRVKVQQSSSALDDCVWVFCSASDGTTATPHLNVEQAARVRDALDAFISEVRDAGPGIEVTEDDGEPVNVTAAELARALTEFGLEVTPHSGRALYTSSGSRASVVHGAVLNPDEVARVLLSALEMYRGYDEEASRG